MINSANVSSAGGNNTDDTLLCRYKFGKCLNPRTFKINGTLHSLCTMHRQRQNAHQLKSDRKRRQRKSLQRDRSSPVFTSTTPTAVPSITDSNVSPAPSIPFLEDDFMRASAIGEAIYCINLNLIKLTHLLMHHDEVARVESCSVLLSLNPENLGTPIPSTIKSKGTADYVVNSSIPAEHNEVAEAMLQSPQHTLPAMVAPYSPRPSSEHPSPLPALSSIVKAHSSCPMNFHRFVV
ncbi:hypothetical protein B5M09_006519 [Aphanomyces astaci]|nr:hypothetical protein B5M09_006519 [Aphanomyces astaci]